MKTRKAKKILTSLKGGFSKENSERIRSYLPTISDIERTQIVHCVSQLRRFCDCFMIGDTRRVLQFGYNLGRLQELCGETTKHTIWWKPIDSRFAKGMTTGDWSELSSYIDTIQQSLGVEYDPATVKGGC